MTATSRVREKKRECGTPFQLAPTAIDGEAESLGQYSDDEPSSPYRRPNLGLLWVFFLSAKWPGSPRRPWVPYMGTITGP